MSSYAERTENARVTKMLESFRAELHGKVWALARHAAQSPTIESLSALIEIKQQIEAVEFALAHRPAHSGMSGPFRGA